MTTPSISPISARLKLPPYGKAALEMRQHGLAPTGWLRIQRIWPREARAWCVVVPFNEDPGPFDLTICSGLSVIVSCSKHDVGNGELISLVEAAKPAFYAVVCDGECIGAFMADGSPLVGSGDE
jgi:hypothetical protein